MSDLEYQTALELNPQLPVHPLFFKPDQDRSRDFINVEFDQQQDAHLIKSESEIGETTPQKHD